MMSQPRGDTENHRPTLSQLSMRDRLQMAACLNDYTESLCPQQIIAVKSEKKIYSKRGGRKSFLSLESILRCLLLANY